MEEAMRRDAAKLLNTKKMAGNGKIWEWLEEESRGGHGQETGQRAIRRKSGNVMEIIWGGGEEILIYVNSKILPQENNGKRDSSNKPENQNIRVYSKWDVHFKLEIYT